MTYIFAIEMKTEYQVVVRLTDWKLNKKRPYYRINAKISVELRQLNFSVLKLRNCE